MEQEAEEEQEQGQDQEAEQGMSIGYYVMQQNSFRVLPTNSNSNKHKPSPDGVGGFTHKLRLIPCLSRGRERRVPTRPRPRPCLLLGRVAKTTLAE